MGAMIVISTELLLPFLPALIWATMVVLSAWPLLLRAQARLGGRRTTAVAVMTIGLLLLLIGPVLFAVLVIINHAGEIVSGGRSLSDVTILPPPEWLERLPVAGAKIAAAWQSFSTTGLEDLSVHVATNVG
jgi:predicted PurR-regulated permease PerM